MSQRETNKRIQLYLERLLRVQIGLLMTLKERELLTHPEVEQILLQGFSPMAAEEDGRDKAFHLALRMLREMPD